jgi:hypothetical protein
VELKTKQLVEVLMEELPLHQVLVQAEVVPEEMEKQLQEPRLHIQVEQEVKASAQPSQELRLVMQVAVEELEVGPITLKYRALVARELVVPVTELQVQKTQVQVVEGS